MAFILCIFIFNGCAKNGDDGKSYITIATDGLGAYFGAITGITYTYDLAIDGNDWDGVWDYNISDDEGCTEGEPPTWSNQLIEPGTYDYTVTIIAHDSGLFSGSESSDTLIYCTTTDTSCPEGGLQTNQPLIVAPNLSGGEPESLIEDGAAGLDTYYLFYISYSGVVIWNSGTVCSN
jgi:hypothetical protein|tara:strand:+ start:95 stop:625 length:531 start_codon:yes stop_codon:yes gene_type:complete